MLTRVFTIITVDHGDPIAVIESARIGDIRVAIGRYSGRDEDCSIVRLSGRNVIPVGRRAYRRYARITLPGLAVIVGDLIVCGDLNLIAYNGLTRTSLCLVNPGARLRAQCGCTVECIRYTGLGVEYA